MAVVEATSGDTAGAAGGAVCSVVLVVVGSDAVGWVSAEGSAAGPSEAVARAADAEVDASVGLSAAVVVPTGSEACDSEFIAIVGRALSCCVGCDFSALSCTVEFMREVMTNLENWKLGYVSTNLDSMQADRPTSTEPPLL